MKKLIKKIVYFLAIGTILVTLCGCDENEKIDPEELRKYAMMCDPETLREYAAMLEDVATELEALENDVEEATVEDEIEDEDEDEAKSEDEEVIDDEDEATVDDEEATDEEATDEEATDEEDETTVEAEDISEDIVEISLSEQYTSEATIGEGKDKVEVSYHIPSIDDGSQAAKKINDEIYDFVKDSVELAEKLADGTADDKFEIPALVNIDYEVYQYNDIASIVITGSDADGKRQFKVINYNTKTQKAVENEELLEYLDLTEEDLHKYITNTIGAYVLSDVEGYIAFIDEFYDVDEPAVASVIGLLGAMYQITVANTDLLDGIVLYVNEEGTPCIAGNISLPEDLGDYDFDMELDVSKEPEMFKKYKKYADDYHYPALEMDCFVLDEGNGYTFEVLKDDRTSDFDYESVSIGFSKEDNSQFVVLFKKDKEELRYTGTVSLAGFSERGIEFEYSLDKCNGEALNKKNMKNGTFSLLVDFEYDEDGNISYQGAKITSIDGFDFTGKNGEEAVFDIVEGFE